MRGGDDLLRLPVRTDRHSARKKIRSYDVALPPARSDAFSVDGGLRVTQHFPRVLARHRFALLVTAVAGPAAGPSFGAGSASAQNAAAPITRHVESNDPRPSANSILAYAIADDGSLAPIDGSPFATGGTGFQDLSFALGPFDNDQQLVLSPDGRSVYAVNAGSNTVAAFHALPDGTLSPLLGWPTGESSLVLSFKKEQVFNVCPVSHPRSG